MMIIAIIVYLISIFGCRLAMRIMYKYYGWEPIGIFSYFLPIANTASMIVGIIGYLFSLPFKFKINENNKFYYWFNNSDIKKK